MRLIRSLLVRRILSGGAENAAQSSYPRPLHGLALLPLVFTGSIPGYEVEHPMAVVILGGLVTSTLLSLFVIPALYLVFGAKREAETVIEDPSHPATA